MPTGLHCLLVGSIDYWQHAIVTCEKPGIANSVAEAWSHNEGRGERIATGVQGTVTGMGRWDAEQRCKWGHGLQRVETEV